ncbi:MAG: ATP synthase F1 subunit gamma [Candidatus Pelagibacter sp. TMED273]|nr:MAG: ATP synthase F1 subunit gamma [Candidatus Pelagibacter sp. TMED273]|tara:strand:- start:25004 stop:25861 length:858 start_codon:yes stop_codon:yes gene_type:complete
MANLKEIRGRIKSIKSIQKVTSAMKMVAAAKLRTSQSNMEKCRPYSGKITSLLNDLIFECNPNDYDLMAKREINKTLYVVITSDRGMAGAFNTNILKKVQSDIDLHDKDNSLIIPIGKKSRDYFKNRNYSIVSEYIEFWGELNFNHAITIGDEIVNLFLSKKVDKVKIYYNEFKNLATQIIKDVDFLPLENLDAEIESSTDRLYEPSKEQILEQLIPKHINVQVWQFLLESYASEQAARMLAMENATDNAGEMIRELGLQYNKARQSAITTEIIEIVSGANALSS